jgi:hypothetical protein
MPQWHEPSCDGCPFKTSCRPRVLDSPVSCRQTSWILDVPTHLVGYLQNLIESEGGLDFEARDPREDVYPSGTPTGRGSVSIAFFNFYTDWDASPSQRAVAKADRITSLVREAEGPFDWAAYRARISRELADLRAKNG